MSERLAVALQYALPKRLLTQLAGKLAGLEGGKATTAVIRWFINRYGVNMAEAANADPASYASFNEFFTRALREDARPLAEADFVCPVDGAISQFGGIEQDQIFQAKGHYYSTTALVGGDAGAGRQLAVGDAAEPFADPQGTYEAEADGSDRRSQHAAGHRMQRGGGDDDRKHRKRGVA